MVEVKLHDIGEGMTEGEVVHYFVNVGDKVKTDQPLVEVQTDKMVAELPSPASGVVKDIKISQGNIVSVGTTLLVLEEEGARNLQPLIEPTPESPAQSVPESTPKQEKVFIKAAPYTRKIAREFGIDIQLVKGTGPHERITVEDVYNFVKQQNHHELSSKEVEKEKISQTVEVKSQPEIQRNNLHENRDVIPFKGRRKQIAKNMTKSLFTIPHVTHFEEVDMTELLAYRSEIKAMGRSISVTAFLIKAIAQGLKKYPIFNAKLDEENELIVLVKDYHIGLSLIHI